MATWWKDRDKAFRIPPRQPARHHDRDAPEDEELPLEDIGDVANDDGLDELDYGERPDRSGDEVLP